MACESTIDVSKTQGASSYSLVNHLNKAIINGMGVLDIEKVVVPNSLLNSREHSDIKNLYKVEFMEDNKLGYFYLKGDGTYYLQ